MLKIKENLKLALEGASCKIYSFLLRIFFGSGDDLMLAMFFAQRILLGKTAFADVPAKLKDQVREILVESGLEELAVETVE